MPAMGSGLSGFCTSGPASNTRAGRATKPESSLREFHGQGPSPSAVHGSQYSGSTQALAFQPQQSERHHRQPSSHHRTPLPDHITAQTQHLPLRTRPVTPPFDTGSEFPRNPRSPLQQQSGDETTPGDPKGKRVEKSSKSRGDDHPSNISTIRRKDDDEDRGKGLFSRLLSSPLKAGRTLRSTTREKQSGQGTRHN